MIVWGDNSKKMTPGTITDNGNGAFTVSGSHRFHKRGKFPVIVLVSDAQGHQGFSISTATVRRRGTNVRHAAPTKLSVAIKAGHVTHDLALGQIDALRKSLNGM
jgi:hypothetical protein